jgi:hypothetical protein
MQHLNRVSRSGRPEDPVLANKLNQDPPLLNIEKVNYPTLFMQCGVSISDLVQAAIPMIETGVIDSQGKDLEP